MNKKFFLIICIVIVVVISVFYNINLNMKNKNKIIIDNKYYSAFYGIDVCGTDIATLINKIDNCNNNNGIKKDNKGFYIENNVNSIKLDMKFLDLEDYIPMESIISNDIRNFIANYGAFKFRCTKIEYHKNNSIKYMLIEEINE